MQLHIISFTKFSIYAIMSTVFTITILTLKNQAIKKMAFHLEYLRLLNYIPRGLFFLS